MLEFTPPQRLVKKVFLHCSASDNINHDDVSVIRDWHVNHNGWSDVGYHFFVKSTGEIQEGRDLEMTPAAQAPYNTGTIAICTHGLTYFSPESMQAVYDLCQAINHAYDGRVTFHGHCEVSNKTCPVYDYKGLLGLDKNGYMQL